MLDLETLRIIRREQPDQRRFSFVGVRLSPEDSTPEFWLPQGFQAFPTDSYERTVDMFFDLFRVFRSYLDSNGLSPDQRTSKRDPLRLGEEGLNFARDTDTPLLTFAKLNVLEAVLEGFDEMVISAIVSKQASRPPESHEEVYKHLDKAIYLEDDRIHFEALPSARNEVISGATQLVKLFCYVYGELSVRVNGSDKLSAEISANASAFKEEYLPENAGLFVQGSFKTTLQVLKEVLERIDRTTPYRDDDFWQLFSAVEVFLYGDINQQVDADGVLWGISDFHPIWEEMCHTYTRELFEAEGDRRILFAHTPQRANDYIAGQAVVNNLPSYPFRMELGGRKRNMLPDMVAESLKEEAARRRFGELITVIKSPVEAVVPERIIVRATPTIDAAQSWLDEIKRLLTRAGWHPTEVTKHQAVFRKIPAKRFDPLFEQTLQKYIRAAVRKRPEVFVIDFKYQHPHEYCGAKLSGKIQDDILKQNVYELAYQYYLDGLGDTRRKIRSQFVVPLYSPDISTPIFLRDGQMPAEMSNHSLCPAFIESRIDLVALPFAAVAQAYTRQT